jgi:hypothetical protein
MIELALSIASGYEVTVISFVGGRSFWILLEVHLTELEPFSTMTIIRKKHYK